MEKNQKINCNVKNCKHHDCKNSCCVLDSITVVNSVAAPTAHYCYDYEADITK